VTLDPFARRYLAAHVETCPLEPETPPEKTIWWKGAEFLELMLPAEGWRLADNLTLLVNYRGFPMWARPPSGVVKRPSMRSPLSYFEWRPVSKHRFYGPGLTDAQKRRAGTAVLRAWGLPEPILQDFVEAMRPILKEQHARITAERKRDEARWEKDYAAGLREKLKAEREEIRFNQTPEGIARAEEMKAQNLKQFTRWITERRVKQEEIERTGKEPPKFCSEKGWEKWNDRLQRQVAKPTPEDVARAREQIARIEQARAEKEKAAGLARG
jgi:hypothetical protein